MRWGRKKSSPSSSSSSPTRIIARVFPVSWFSKSKQKGSNLESDKSTRKNTKRCDLDYPTPKNSSSLPPAEGRFYTMDEVDDPYWRLSFGEEIIRCRRSTGGINPLWYDDSSDHDEFQSHVPNFKKFSDMVLDIKKMKERELEKRTMAMNGGDAFRSRKAKKELKIQREIQGELGRWLEDDDDDGDENLNSVERVTFPVEPESMVQMRDNFLNLAVSNSRKQSKIPRSSVKEDCSFEALNIDGSIAPCEKVSISEWQSLEDEKFMEIIKVKTESDSRKTDKKKRVVKAYSPRTECRIRALENMKRARMKSKEKEIKERVMVEGSSKTIFDSFAVVKSSFDPRRDFRDSMVEMIREKGIGRPEDLERLLACYLTLNHDEHHDLIIKVFRQVWMEMNGAFIDDPPIQNGQY